VADDRLLHFLRITATSVIFSALAAPITAIILMIAPAAVGSDRKELRELADLATGLFPFVCIYTAPFGVVLGFLGGIWLGVVGQRTRARIRLVGHGLLAGCVLSLPVLLFALATGPPSGIGGNGRFAFFSMAVGGSVGALYASLFARILIRRPSSEFPWASGPPMGMKAHS